MVRRLGGGSGNRGNPRGKKALSKNIISDDEPRADQISGIASHRESMESSLKEGYGKLKNSPKTAKVFAEFEAELIEARGILKGLHGQEAYAKKQELLDSGSPLSIKVRQLNIRTDGLNKKLSYDERFMTIYKNNLEKLLSG